MPLKTINVCSAWIGGLLLFLVGPGLVSTARAQRHPESAGALPYYSTEPGTPQDPDWTLRPPFLRGPQDRWNRGRSRAFLNADDSIPYLNYADEKYILYFRETIPWALTSGRQLETRNVRWDRMGNYMGGSYARLLSVEESRSGSDFSGYSYIDHKFLSFRVGHYTYKGLHWTATVGNGVSGSYVRTIFTPLTFTSSLRNTLRLDLNYKEKDRGTLFYSRGGEQGAALLFSEWAFGAGDDTWENSPVLAFGGHWQHNVGEYITFGTTLVNQIMSSPALSRSNLWRGDLPYDMLGPKTIRVFIADDSPEDLQANAQVFGVDIVLEGERAGQALRLTSLNDDADYDPGLEAAPPQGGVPLQGDGLEAVGQDAVIYTFTLPADMTVRSARFVADVAGDYRLGVRQTHDLFTIDRQGNTVLEEMEWPGTVASGTEAATRRPFKWYSFAEEEPYYTYMRSSGRNGSGSNRRLVSFDYGMPTGQSLASLNWQAELVGLDLSGEVGHNLQHRMFPVGNNEGLRTQERAWAWWVKGVKDLAGGLALGGEAYRMEPDYAGGYDSYRGGMAFHIDQQPRPGDRVESVTHEFPLHEDNDDHDQFPDDHQSDSAVAQPRELYPGFPHSQVYPGLDDNADNIPDVDRNENFIVDWEEPFLTYDSEPPEFVYGIDFNNNGVPDFRENDDLPDYPYPRDQKGQHLFLRFDKLGGLGKYLSAGGYDTRQLVGGGRSQGLYLRYEYAVSKRGVGSLQFNYDLKKVEDDIADHTFVYQVALDDLEVINWFNRPDGPPEEAGRWRPATPDLLLMQDSWVNWAFFESTYLGFPQIKIENALLWFRNSQAEIAGVQLADVRSRWALVNKIDYTWSGGALQVTPKLKHRTFVESLDSEADARVSYSELVPIVMAQYQMTPRTSFLAGAQGLPGLNFKRWDRADKDASYRRTDYIAMVKLTADYFGIRDNSFMIGYQRTRQDFDRAGRPDLKQGVLFVELMSPF